VRRRRKAPPPGSAAGELLALEAECAVAAAGGDGRAVALLGQVRSRQAMVAAAGGDAEIAALFAIFAAEGRSRMSKWWSNPR
jgi:hypothetical protein